VKIRVVIYANIHIYNALHLNTILEFVNCINIGNNFQEIKTVPTKILIITIGINVNEVSLLRSAFESANCS